MMSRKIGQSQSTQRGRPSEVKCFQASDRDILFLCQQKIKEIRCYSHSLWSSPYCWLGCKEYVELMIIKRTMLSYTFLCWCILMKIKIFAIMKSNCENWELNYPNVIKYTMVNIIVFLVAGSPFLFLHKDSLT